MIQSLSSNSQKKQKKFLAKFLKISSQNDEDIFIKKFSELLGDGFFNKIAS